MNKQQLASKIWESANKMRSKIEAYEYKDYILGFIFYKFLSDKELKFLRDNGWSVGDIRASLTENDAESVGYVQRNLGYFISHENLFSTWIAQGGDFSSDAVSTALSAFSRLIDAKHRKVFDGVFATLETGLSKLGDTSGARTKAIRDLLYLIKDIPMDGRQDYDVLGFIYEYLIGQFAAKRMDGANRIKYYAQELKENTYNLTRMNLVMRGILPDNIFCRNGDTLEEDWPYFDENDPVRTYSPLYVDAVVSNPPYSQAWKPADKENDPRYARFGLAPKGKADYAFLLHDLFHLKNDGIMTIVLPHGVLFRGGEEGTIRKNLIENNHIDTIIGLPANIFFGTGIPTIIMVLRQKRTNTDVLIIDASKGFVKEGKNNKLRACDIKRIADTVTARKSIDKFSKVVSRDEIRANGYNLNIPRYVDSSEKAESFDIYASMFGGIPAGELEGLGEYWRAFPGLKGALFAPADGAGFTLKTPDVRETVMRHPAVGHFLGGYSAAFDTLPAFLRSELIDAMQTVSIPREEARLSGDIFARLAGVPLVDAYEAYELLDDAWNRIAGDLEVLQTEGPEAARQVDANLVVKKKNGRDVEAQEGWAGHIMPFELVRKMLLPDKLGKLESLKSRLAEITSSYEELLDEIGEEEKEQPFINDAKDAFVAAEVKKVVKAKECEPETLVVLKKVDKLTAEEKTVKKQIKDAEAELQTATKRAIETLSDTDVSKLLNAKWITPLCESLANLPHNVLNAFIAKVEAVSTKYDSTFADIESQISETEHSLCSLIDELTGSEFDLKGLNEFKKLLEGE
ncbi:MAG: N-6 DNA methylase [Akkermansiaceae bacterium]|nr:N-6 DNA methylase [Akkermansiaceae bacterium]